MKSADTARVKKKAPKKKIIQEELVKWEYNPPTFFYERLKPMGREQLRDIAREMIAWAQQDTSLVFSKFFSERKPPLSMSDLYDKMKENEELKGAVELTKQILQGRREEGGITWKYNFNAIKETQPLYDPEYKVWKLEAIKNTADNVEKIVVLPAIPKPTDEPRDV